MEPRHRVEEQHLPGHGWEKTEAEQRHAREREYACYELEEARLLGTEARGDRTGRRAYLGHRR